MTKPRPEQTAAESRPRGVGLGRMGRPTKLTPSAQRMIVEILQQGGTVRMACGMAGIHHDSFYEWMERGRKQRQGMFREFVLAVERAQATARMLALRTIRLSIVGGWFPTPVYDKDGNPIPIADPETGEQKLTENGRPEFMMRHAFQKPDPWLALRWFALSEPELGGGPRGAALKRDEKAGRAGEEQQHRFDLDPEVLKKAVGCLLSLGQEIPGYEVRPLSPDAEEPSSAKEQRE